MKFGKVVPGESAVARCAVAQLTNHIEATASGNQLKEPQFRAEQSAIAALREWQVLAASFVREASQRIIHEQLMGDRLVNFAD
jgi:hypothetical protein